MRSQSAAARAMAVPYSNMAQGPPPQIMCPSHTRAQLPPKSNTHVTLMLCRVVPQHPNAAAATQAGNWRVVVWVLGEGLITQLLFFGIIVAGLSTSRTPLPLPVPPPFLPHLSLTFICSFLQHSVICPKSQA